MIRRVISIVLALAICLAAFGVVVSPVQASEEQELFLVAQKAFDDGFYDVAIRYLNQYLNEYPLGRTEQAKLLLGQCHFFKGQHLKAFEFFKGQLGSKQFRDVALFWLGETYHKTKDYAEAEKHYQLLLSEFPDSFYAPQARYSLGWTFYDQNRFEKARDQFVLFLKQYPDHALADDSFFKMSECEYNLGNYAEAIRSFQDYVQTYPRSKRHDKAYFYIGESFYYSGQYDRAADYYHKAVDVSENPQLIMISQVSMGWSYLKLKDFDRALEQFNAAQTISLENSLPSDEIHLGLASLYFEKEDHAKALEAYNYLLDNFQDSKRRTEALLGKANTLYALGRYPEAREAYIELIDSNSAKNGRRNELVEKAYFGLAWTQLKEGKTEDAIKTFNNVISLTTSKIVKLSAMTQIGDAYQDIGQMDKALEAYDKILTESPESPYSDYIQYRQGIALLKLNRIDAATMAFQSLKTNFPQSQYLNDTKYYLGLAYFKNEKWTAARDQMAAFLEGTSGTNEFRPDAMYILASSMFNLAQYEEAMKYFREIIKNYPARKNLKKEAEISIAKCLYGLGDTKEALKRFKIIAYKYPNSETEMEVLLWISDYYTKALDYENAALYYNQILDHFPQSEKTDTVRYRLGEVYQMQGKYDEALNQFKQLTDSTDENIAAKAELAIADIFSKRLEPETAISTYEKIARNSPEFKRDALVKIAELHTEQKSYPEAIQAYQTALEAPGTHSDFSSAEIQFRIGDTHELNNQEQKAIEAYLKLPYLYPNQKEWIVKAYLRMARIFEDEEDWENAKLVYNKIIDYGTDEVKFAQERLEWIRENIENASLY